VKFRTSWVWGAAAVGVLASGGLPVAVAFADSASVDGFVSAPGPDAFTLGGVEFDPYLGTPDALSMEGFNIPSNVTGTPPYFETGSVNPQVFEVFSPTNGSSPVTEIGTVATNENVTTYGSITNTGFDVLDRFPMGEGGASVPAIGTYYDVTNFGGGMENEYINTPVTGSTTPSITDTLITPYGDENLSSLFAGTNFAPLNPGAAFGITAPNYSGPAGFASTPGVHAFTIGGTEFDPYQGSPGSIASEGFTTPNEINGTPPYFETASVDGQVFQVFDPATSSSPATALGGFAGNENVTTFGSITNTGFDVGQLIPADNANGIAGLPQYGTLYDVTNFGNGVENEYVNIPATTLTSGSITDTLVTPYGDYDLSNLFAGSHIVDLDPGAAFGVGADTATAATEAATNIDPLSFLGL
jgi:hypothetical protein